ncbi:MAG: methyltransferase domain-containing protein [Leptolyngbyaceae bacterium]|nr:methyltransferase domain-containing protein [Leptolyngbyaceae bacterium]
MIDLNGFFRRYVKRLIKGKQLEYRSFLFEDLLTCLDGREVKRILEIGPRDGVDSLRLLQLKPDLLVLIDLPEKHDLINGWLGKLPSAKVELILGNIMYDERIRKLEPFDVVWCTGVLYHNPEQLRMVRMLFDLVKPEGVLVIESATARRRGLRDEACVELWHGVDKNVMRTYHLSSNITHLPSRKAIHAWLDMVGFSKVNLSSCHRRVSRGLAGSRSAFIARRLPGDYPRGYYLSSGSGFDVGGAS